MTEFGLLLPPDWSQAAAEGSLEDVARALLREDHTRFRVCARVDEGEWRPLEPDEDVALFNCIERLDPRRSRR